MPRKKVERPRTDFDILYVRNSKFNTNNGTSQDRKCHPNFGYMDENNDLRFMRYALSSSHDDVYGL